MLDFVRQRHALLLVCICNVVVSSHVVAATAAFAHPKVFGSQGLIEGALQRRNHPSCRVQTVDRISLAQSTLNSDPEEDTARVSPPSSSTDQPAFSPLTAGTFNPFKYDAKLGLSTSQPLSASSSSFQSRNGRGSNVISLRRTQMQALTNSMLNAVPFDTKQLQSILRHYQQFLLEPLEDDDALQDDGDGESIYRHCVNRSERYRAFAESMDSRLQKVRDPSARLVLSTMRDFVLQFEHEPHSA